MAANPGPPVTGSSTACPCPSATHLDLGLERVRPPTPGPGSYFRGCFCPHFTLRKDRLLAWHVSILALVLETGGGIWREVRSRAA